MREDKSPRSPVWTSYGPTGGVRILNEIPIVRRYKIRIDDWSPVRAYRDVLQWTPPSTTRSFCGRHRTSFIAGDDDDALERIKWFVRAGRLL